jgi:hypothetical protein
MKPFRRSLRLKVNWSASTPKIMGESLRARVHWYEDFWRNLRLKVKWNASTPKIIRERWLRARVHWYEDFLA